MENLTIHNAIELGEDISLEAKGKGRYFQSRFIEAGLAHYEQFGDVLITKETLDKFIFSMVGCPVIIKHKDITEENADKERVGVVSKVWYNELDGWYWCEGIIWDKQAIDLIKNQGWSVSCTYDFESDFKKGTYHGKDYDMEFIGGEFLHLALVPNPRYERANIVVNSKDFNEEDVNRVPKGEEGAGQFAEKADFEKIYQDLLEKNNNKLPEKKEDLEALLKTTLGEEFYKANINKIKEIEGLNKILADKAYKSNNEGDLIMTVLNELKEFIQNVVNNKGDDMNAENEKVDKRDIIRQIMAIAGKEEASEDVKTIAKLAEKLAYDKSEAGTADNKCKNEEDEEKEEKFEEEKEIAENKCKNEEEDKEEAENEEEEDKKEKVENSIEDTKQIVFGGKQVSQIDYIPHSKRIELGNNY